MKVMDVFIIILCKVHLFIVITTQSMTTAMNSQTTGRVKWVGGKVRY